MLRARAKSSTPGKGERADNGYEVVEVKGVVLVVREGVAGSEEGAFDPNS